MTIFFNIINIKLKQKNLQAQVAIIVIPNAKSLGSVFVFYRVIIADYAQYINLIYIKFIINIVITPGMPKTADIAILSGVIATGTAMNFDNSHNTPSRPVPPDAVKSILFSTPPKRI